MSSVSATQDPDQVVAVVGDGQRDGQVAPVQEVGGDGVRPLAGVLVEEVVLPLVVDESVGVAAYPLRPADGGPCLVTRFSNAR